MSSIRHCEGEAQSKPVFAKLDCVTLRVRNDGAQDFRNCSTWNINFDIKNSNESHAERNIAQKQGKNPFARFQYFHSLDRLSGNIRFSEIQNFQKKYQSGRTMSKKERKRRRFQRHRQNKGKKIYIESSQRR
jgi:hypothetical protein